MKAWIRPCGMALVCLTLGGAQPLARGQQSEFDAANRASAEGKWVEAVRG